MPTTSDRIASLAYKPGWRFRLGGPLNRYLCVYAVTPNSWPPHAERVTQHQFPIPSDLTDEAWPRWVLDRLLEVEHHEAMEFLQVDGRRPFYPAHQGEGSPYEIIDRSA